MAIVNGSLQEGYKDAAWFAANPTLVLLVGQKVHLEQTGTYKLGDGTTQLSALSFLGGGGTVDVNTIGSAINGAASATPNDTDLVMSVETSVAKKNTWTQIKAFLKTYYDTVYTKRSTLTANTIPKATASDTIGNSQITDDGTNVGVTGNIQIGGVADSRLYIKNPNGNYYIAVETGGGASVFYINPNGRVSIGTLQDTYKLKVDGSFASATIVDDGANVGINTLPSEKLHVNGNIRCDNLTASELTATDASKNIVSLPVATYPSLTELSYGKGVTSAIQTQLDGLAPIASPTFTGTPLAPTASANTNNTQIATTAYVDGKSLFRSTTDSLTHTGTLTNTIIWSEDISNKLSSGDIADLISDVVRVSGSTYATIRYYLNSSASLSGATQIGQYVYGFSGLNIADFRRQLIVKSSTVIRVKGSISAPLNDFGVFSNYADVTVNLASLYVIFAITLGNTGDQFLVSSRKMVR